MRKLFVGFAALLMLTNSFASVPPSETPGKNANQVFVPIGNTGKQISLYDFSRIRLRDFEKEAGYKLKFTEKVTFKLAQGELKQSINEDGTINSKRMEKGLRRLGGETGFHIGGFALGFLLGLLGVVIAYVIKDDYKRNRVKWAWIGLGTWLVVYLVLIASLL
jgi:hypothetical protein